MGVSVMSLVYQGPLGGNKVSEVRLIITSLFLQITIYLPGVMVEMGVWQ